MTKINLEPLIKTAKGTLINADAPHVIFEINNEMWGNTTLEISLFHGRVA
jgi:hypothetical protein